MSTRNVLQAVVFGMAFAVTLATTQAAMVWDASSQFSTTSNTVADTWQYLAVAEGANTGYSLLATYGYCPQAAIVGWRNGYYADVPCVGGPDATSLYLLPGPGTSAVIGWKSPLVGTATVDYSFAISPLTEQGPRTYALFKVGEVTALQSGNLAAGASTGTITGTVSIANGQMLCLQLGPNGSGGSDYYYDDSRVVFSVSNVPEPASVLVLGLGVVGLFGATGRRRT
jgi:hypothetical protein